MGITKLVFGFDRSDVTALQESQLGDATQFQKLSDLLGELQKSQTGDAEKFQNILSELGKLQSSQTGDATQFQKISDLLGELQTNQTGDAEKFQKVQEYLDGLQEKVETLTETVADQEKTLLICAIASAVAAIAITSFVAFCIYQGVKLEREKEKNLSKDTPDTKLDGNNIVRHETPLIDLLS
jgi:predicted nuclease with TOPRIM domain